MGPGLRIESVDAPLVEGRRRGRWTFGSVVEAGRRLRAQRLLFAHRRREVVVARLGLAPGVNHWSLTTLRDKLIKIGAKVVTHARYVIFQMAEVAVPKRLFRTILERIRRLRVPETVPGCWGHASRQPEDTEATGVVCQNRVQRPA